MVEVKRVEVKVLGTGCAKCEKLYAEAERAIAASGVEATLRKVESMDEIMSYGVMMTPALVVDERVLSSGRVPSRSRIVRWLTSAAMARQD